MVACQFAAACVCQRTQIITLRDGESLHYLWGWMSERGNDTACDFDGDDFLLVIIQQYYRFETFGAAGISVWRQRQKEKTLESKSVFSFFFLQREEKKNEKKSLRRNFCERDTEHPSQQKHTLLPRTITRSS